MRFLLAGVLALAGAVASAQTVERTLSLSWQLPTHSVDGLPLTGSAELTEVRVYLSTSPIDSPRPATITLGPGETSVEHTMAVTNGQTIYARVRACNRSSDSVLQCSDYSEQASKHIVLDTTPGMPTEVTIVIEVQAG